MTQAGTCCRDVQEQRDWRCGTHPNLADCPGSLLVFTAAGRVGIRVHDGGSSYYGINYCPWCGADLSKGH